MTVAVAGRTGEWLEDPGFGIYVHIPFCLRRCHYCDFNVHAGQIELHTRYVDALVEDIKRWPDDMSRATSVFFGGGTPTILPAHELVRVLEAIQGRFSVDRDAEVTVEANPETVDERAFEALLEGGINRFSIGVQSLAPRVLAGLGRTHTAERALYALGAARRAGAEDLNADLMYGSPWERPGDFLRSLEGVIAVAPDHVSAYALTVEEGTPLHTLVATGRVPAVDPDVQAERFVVAAEALSSAGYHRYEVSNSAKPGRASRHNVLYWSAGDYLGFGAGAHSHISGRRFSSVRLPRHYIERVEGEVTTEAGSETLAPDKRTGEALMLGLRLASGVDVAGVSRRFGPAALAARAPAIAELKRAGLLEWSDGRLRIPQGAVLVANEVLERLL